MHLHTLLFTLFLVALATADPTITTATAFDSDSTFSEPFVDNSPACTLGVREAIIIYDGIGTFNIDGGDILAFDLIQPFNALPTFDIAFGSCDAASGSYSCSYGAFNSGLSPVALGDSNSNNFDFGFIIPTAGAYSHTSNVFAIRIRYGNNEIGGVVGSSINPLSINPSATSFVSTYCIDSALNPGDTDITDGLLDSIPVPSFQVLQCSTFSLVDCGVPSPSVFTTPGLCSATVPLFTQADMTFGSDPGLCTVTITTTGELDPFPANQPGESTEVVYTALVEASDLSVQCSSFVSVTDNEPPMLACPVSQELDPQFCGTTFPSYIFTDNCPGASDQDTLLLPLPFGNVYVHNVVITDDIGLTTECTYALTVPDTFSFPNCPSSPITSDNDPGLCTAFINVEPEVGTVPVSGCPDNVLYTNYPEEGYDYPVGTSTYLAISNNSTGFGNTCTFPIIVDDIDPPTIECPLDVEVFTEDASGSVVFYEDPVIRDNCIGNVISDSSSRPGDFFPVGTTLIDYWAYDGFHNVSCDFNVRVTRVFTSVTPSSTPVFVPTPSKTNTPTRDAPPSPQVSRDQVSASPSNTPSRSFNPSVTSSTSESPSPAPSTSSSASPTSSPSSSASSTASPSRTASSTNSPAPSTSDSRSRYVPSVTPSRTPQIAPVVFDQVGRNALVELIIPCQRSVCSAEEVQLYLDEIAIALGISFDSVQLVNVFGDEVTFLICGSEDIGDLLNNINSGDAPEVFSGTFVEGATFDVSCGEVVVVESSDAYTLHVIAAMFIFTLFLL